eukprot:GDKJ01018601.1.p1 GENE.GDKJ01018601.1~~GDKJ01018601.1.p1  ORF type:complete len:614 (+),score=114.28 GDKJ01018601.1:22-1842(+)
MSNCSRLIENLAKRPIRSLSINELVSNARSISTGKNGSIDNLMRSANWVQSELPVRLAHRLHDFERLPFAVFQASNVKQVYDMHVKAMSEVHSFGKVDSHNQGKFIEMITRHVDDTIDVIKFLQMGIAELRAIHPDISLDTFLERFFATRIGSRLLTEHYLALHDDYEILNSATPSEPRPSSFAGVIHQKVSLRDVTRQCLERVSRIDCIKSMPHVTIEVVGDTGRVESRYSTLPNLSTSCKDVNIAYVPEHVRFILFELIKNSVKATIDANPNSPGSQTSSSPSALAANTSSSAQDSLSSSCIGSSPNEYYGRGKQAKSARSLLEDGVSSDVAALFAEDDEVEEFSKHLLSNDAKLAFSEQHNADDKFTFNLCKPIDASLPPITIRLSHSSQHVVVDIIDQGVGINPHTKDKIWNYGFTTVQDFCTSETKALLSASSHPESSFPISLQHDDFLNKRELAGYGFGLPLTRLYARYFGGDVQLLSNATAAANQQSSPLLSFLDQGTTARVKLYAVGDHHEPLTLTKSCTGKVLDPLKAFQQQQLMMQQQQQQSQSASKIAATSSTSVQPTTNKQISARAMSTLIAGGGASSGVELMVPGRIGFEKFI